MDPTIRNMKDFLLLYNKLTELCFCRCVDNLYGRDLSPNEDQCVSRCVNKYASFNQAIMKIYVKAQSEINQKRIIEIEEAQKSIELKKQEQMLEEANAKKQELLPAVKEDSTEAGSKKKAKLISW